MAFLEEREEKDVITLWGNLRKVDEIRKSDEKGQKDYNIKTRKAARMSRNSSFQLHSAKVPRQTELTVSL